VGLGQLATCTWVIISGAVKTFCKCSTNTAVSFLYADLHSLTTHPTPTDLHGNVRKILAEYLACGLDPEVSTIYCSK
jgi:tryptophanyl-tRNA synthetase